jgi:fructose-1,6-bisphosphatase
LIIGPGSNEVCVETAADGKEKKNIVGKNIFSIMAQKRRGLRKMPERQLEQPSPAQVATEFAIRGVRIQIQLQFGQKSYSKYSNLASK